VQIATPPPVQQTITATQTPPPAQTAMVPVAPPVTAPAAAAPAPVSAAVVCSNYTTVMGDAGFPREAAKQGIERGEAVIQFTVSANGAIRDIKVIRSTHPIFSRNSVRIVGEYKCQGQGHDVLVQVPFGYKLE
jgi:protein TonB